MRKCDLLNQKFGKLTVISRAPNNKGGRTMWLCNCDCGVYKVVSTKNLKSGECSSCGCEWRVQNKKHASWKGFGDIPRDFFSNIKRGASSRCIEFNISIEYLWELLIKQKYRCALSGISLQFSKIRKDHKGKNISLDRIDNQKGYIEGNVQFVHKHINIMKNKFNQDYFIDLCKHIANENKVKNMKENKNDWSTITHVESSMSKKDNQFSLFIGRWQSPNGLHDGHKALFQQVLKKGGKVCIAIRDMQPDEKNPLTSIEVMKNITEQYIELIEEGRIRVLIIPDIASVEFGRGVGYDIIEHIPPSEIAEISATKIREEMRKNGTL